MTASKREADIGVSLARSPERRTQTPLIARAFDAHVFGRELRLDATLLTATLYDFERVPVLRRDDGAHARADDCGLLRRDRRERVAQVFLMVERDGRYRDSRS